MIGGGGVTVKTTGLVAIPLTVTMTFPVVAPVGTGAVMVVALQFVGVAATPLNVTVLGPCVAPKPVPVIVTGAPTAPDEGLRLVTLIGGGPVMVNTTPLLKVPGPLTTTSPVEAPDGTGTT